MKLIITLALLGWLISAFIRAKRDITGRLDETEKELGRQMEAQERLEKAVAKHDEEINKLTFRMEQAEADIDHWKEQIGNLYALLDVAQNELEQSIIGGKNQAKYQKQIITLSNQIHAAEARLAKAQYTRDEASRKLAA